MPYPIHRLQTPTPGAANAAIRVSDVVINELMYHPISDEADDQYIELYNRGAIPVSRRRMGTGWTSGHHTATPPTKKHRCSTACTVACRSALS